jgi:hypothetical protein
MSRACWQWAALVTDACQDKIQEQFEVENGTRLAWPHSAGELASEPGKTYWIKLDFLPNDEDLAYWSRVVVNGDPVHRQGHEVVWELYAIRSE